MEKYDLKKGNVKFHNIVIAVTTKPDYEMNRYLLLEDLKDLEYGEFVIVEGGHCSCYDFDDVRNKNIFALGSFETKRDNISNN